MSGRFPLAEDARFCLLGPLLVRCGTATVPVPRGKQRVLLAALLLNANRVLSLGELTELLWEGQKPPPSARVTLQNYVKRLRRVLGDVSSDRITTHPDAYSMTLSPGELDVTRFERLANDGREAALAGSFERAAQQLREALALWRGQPLADVPCDQLALREVPRLDQLRWRALEDRIEADLRLGRQSDVIAELGQLAVAEPLRERVHGLLMLALYQDGRQGDALRAYQHARLVLVEELGADPGPALRDLHQRILAGDDALPSSAIAGKRGTSRAAVPRQLPAPVRNFTGREPELRFLRMLAEQVGADGTPVTAVIHGTAGVGKTALAVHWAHRASSGFPDGQLYVDLRGYDHEQPLPAAEALAGFLRALGLPGRDIPAEVGERAARYRSLLAERRMLIVLDNVGEAAQVRPLLPGGPACLVLVTSRDSLAGLVARDSACRLDLDLLPPDEAAALLRVLIGRRAAADPAAVTTLAGQCAHLPLALRLAAELAVALPEVPLAGLTSELADQQARLDLLDAGGDPQTAVRAVFSWSCRHLDVTAGQAFRLLGLHPGTDFDHYAAAALTGTAPDQAARVVNQLTRASLIQPAGPGRFGMHDLLRAYARELGTSQDSAAERHAALTCLFDYYLHTAAAAMDTLHPAERHWRPGNLPLAAAVPSVTDHAAARAWLDAHLAVLVAVATYTCLHGWPGHTVRLAATMFRYLDAGDHCSEALIMHSHARRAARETGDNTAEAAVLSNLGRAVFRQGRCEQANEYLGQALALFREVGDLPGQARALGNLSLIGYHQGRYPRATEQLQEALALFRELGDQASEARALGSLGIADLRQGRYQQAADSFGHALALFRDSEDRAGEARAMSGLGTVQCRRGHSEQAMRQFQQALALFRGIGDRTGEAYASTHLGAALLQRGDCQEQASLEFRRALELFRQIGDRSGEAHVLNRLGELCRATGRTDESLSRHSRALRLAVQTGDHYEQARAHDGLADIYDCAGDRDQARGHWAEALSRFDDIGAPEAGRIRARLTAADDPLPDG